MDDSVDGADDQEGYLQEQRHQEESLQEAGADRTMCMSHDPELLAPLFPSKSAAFNLGLQVLSPLFRTPYTLP